MTVARRYAVWANPRSVKVKVTNAWKLLKTSRPSVPHGTNFYFFSKSTSFLWRLDILENVPRSTALRPLEKCLSIYLKCFWNALHEGQQSTACTLLSFPSRPPSLTVDRIKRVNVRYQTKFLGRTVAEIWRFLDFQDGGHLPSWIFKSSKF